MGAHNIITSHAVVADPVLSAIAAHRAVAATIDTMTGDEPEWETMLASEISSYAEVCQIVPTTLDGICQKAGYLTEVGVAGFPAEHVNAALLSFATATASLGKVASADAHDPLIQAIEVYKAARDAALALPDDDKMDAAFDDAYNNRVLPLFFKIDGLAPTTMAGALLALQFLKDENEGGPSALNDSLINGVVAFLEGRSS